MVKLGPITQCAEGPPAACELPREEEGWSLPPAVWKDFRVLCLGYLSCGVWVRISKASWLRLCGLSK